MHDQKSNRSMHFNVFEPANMAREFRWLNEPSAWRREGGRLEIVPDPETDMFCGIRSLARDDAAFLYRDVTSNFRFAVELDVTTKGFADAGGILVRDSRARLKLC